MRNPWEKGKDAQLWKLEYSWEFWSSRSWAIRCVSYLLIPYLPVMARTRRISTITWRPRAVSFFIIPSWHYLAFIKQLIIHPICITRISNSGTRPFFLSDRYHILEMEFRHWSLFLFLIFVVAYAPIRFLKILPNTCRIIEDLLTLLSFSFARISFVLDRFEDVNAAYIAELTKTKSSIAETWKGSQILWEAVLKDETAQRTLS